MRVVLSVLLMCCFFSTAHAAEVLFCSGKSKAGMAPAEDYKVYPFEERRFSLKVDFRRMTMESQELGFFDPYYSCHWNEKNSVLYCLNMFGNVIGVSQLTYEYYFATMYLSDSRPRDRDTVTIEYGRCERF